MTKTLVIPYKHKIQILLYNGGILLIEGFLVWCYLVNITSLILASIIVRLKNPVVSYSKDQLHKILKYTRQFSVDSSIQYTSL